MLSLILCVRTTEVNSIVLLMLMYHLRSSLASMRAPELGAIAIKAAVERAAVDPKAVQEVSFVTLFAFLTVIRVIIIYLLQ